MDLADAGAAEQARLVRARDVTAREVVEAALRRIEALDPELNAFRSVRAEPALEEAADVPDGPLAGVPVAIKDDTHVAGELTCYGSAAYDRRPEHDAEVVARLRRAGAVVVGKTHVPELDSWGFTESTAFGVTRNPWDRSRNSGGSSGGSAVAALTGMCGVALGTDGTGSIRNPSSWCATLGLKPGRGTIPGPAALTGWHGMVVNGPIARHAADAAAFMEAATGRPFHTEHPGRLRIAMTFKQPPGMGGSLDDARRDAVHQAAELLRSLGHEVFERDPELPKLTTLAIDARYFHGIAEDAAQAEDPERLEPRTRRVARLGRALAPALRLAPRIERAAASALDATGADVLLFPGSVEPPWPVGQFHGSGALRPAYMDTARVAFQPLWNLVGRPAAMVPWGLDAEGLPTSVQLGGRPGGEQVLLSLAAQIEQHHPAPAWSPPAMRAPSLTG